MTFLRGLRLPVARSPTYVVRAARRDDPARDGAHVVRRPGHDAVVGRPVAQRVVRRRGRRVLCQAEATEYTEAWTTFANVEKTWAYRQDQLPSTHPIAADIPDLRGRRGQLRRHHLRQGRLGAQAAGRLRRAARRSSPACAPTSASTRTATPRSPTCSARSRRPRPRPVALGPAVAGDHRAQHAARRLRRRRRRPVHPLRGHQSGAEPGAGELRRTGWPSASTTTTERQAGAHAPRRARRRRTDGPRCPSWSGAAGRPGAGQRRRPDLLQGATGPRVAADASSTRIADIAESLPRTLVGRRRGR